METSDESLRSMMIAHLDDVNKLMKHHGLITSDVECKRLNFVFNEVHNLVGAMNFSAESLVALNSHLHQTVFNGLSPVPITEVDSEMHLWEICREAEHKGNRIILSDK